MRNFHSWQHEISIYEISSVKSPEIFLCLYNMNFVKYIFASFIFCSGQYIYEPAQRRLVRSRRANWNTIAILWCYLVRMCSVCLPHVHLTYLHTSCVFAFWDKVHLCVLRCNSQLIFVSNEKRPVVSICLQHVAACTVGATHIFKLHTGVSRLRKRREKSLVTTDFRRFHCAPS
jgi:hypothetical protein